MHRVMSVHRQPRLTLLAEELFAAMKDTVNVPITYTTSMAAVPAMLRIMACLLVATDDTCTAWLTNNGLVNTARRSTSCAFSQMGAAHKRRRLRHAQEHVVANGLRFVYFGILRVHDLLERATQSQRNQPSSRPVPPRGVCLHQDIGACSFTTYQ